MEKENKILKEENNEKEVNSYWLPIGICLGSSFSNNKDKNGMEK